MNGEGEIVGMVDVLKLTYATLEQINTMGSGESEGPLEQVLGCQWTMTPNRSCRVKVATAPPHPGFVQ